MQRLGGAVIHMQLSFDELEYVIGDAERAENIRNLKSLRPFDDNVLAFFNALSSILRTNREFSDVATFGFWCRKAALQIEKSKYDDLSTRLGKGVVFHSTPSNVPVNFAFSFAAGMLAGNANIVRLPGKPYEQVDLICKTIKNLLETEYVELAPYVCFVKFPPKKEITDAFSMLCDVRVIWGGDGTVSELRQSPIPARTTEITFADRHSIAVIDADEYLKCDNKEKVTVDFYNDTYFSDQNACTSPRIIFWKGDAIEEAKKEFWRRVQKMIDGKYILAPVQSVGKLTALYRVAAQKNVKKVASDNMLLTRVHVDEIDTDLMKYKYNSGFFFEYDIRDLSEIIPVCNNRCQTLTYFGLSNEEIKGFFENCRPQGIDRAVPMGKSMDFTLVWDGYDLIRTMSRKVNVI